MSSQQNPPAATDPPPPAGDRRLFRTLKLCGRIGVLVLVAAGIAWTLYGSIDEFQRQKFSLWEIHYGWLAASGLLYLLGMFPAAIFYYDALRAMGQRPEPGKTLRAYYISQLGKYVPGKAMVIIMRASLLRSPQVQGTVAATAVFVETLTMMAVGAVIGAVVLAAVHLDQTILLLIAAGMALLAGLPTLPPIFRRLVLVAQVQRINPEIEKSLAGLTFSLMLRGWIATSLGWAVMGLSLMAALMAMPPVSVEVQAAIGGLLAVDLGSRGQPGGRLTLAGAIWLWPSMTACVALAVVAGFLALIPGGIFVRELIVMTLLAPDFGEVAAVMSAVFIRFSWLIAELALAGMLVAIGRKNTRSPVE